MKKYLPVFVLIAISGCSIFKIDTPVTMTARNQKEIKRSIANEQNSCKFGRIRKIEYCPDESDFKMNRECYRATYSSGIAFDVYKQKEKYEVSLPIYGVKNGETIYQLSGCPY